MLGTGFNGEKIFSTHKQEFCIHELKVIKIDHNVGPFLKAQYVHYTKC